MPTKEQITFGAIVAGISAFVAMLSGIATLYTQAEPIVTSAIKKDFAPVGSVIASVLPEEAFANIIGENIGDDYKTRKWILADGRIVNGTAYARANHNRPVPDLRGMFLRGIDPNSNRIAGDIQGYATALPKHESFSGTTDPAGSHHHSGGARNIPGERYDVGHNNYDAVAFVNTGDAGEHTHTFKVTAGGDDETRPINVAVYYYIKIN